MIDETAAIDRFHGEFAWLSNFYPVAIELDGEIYPTIEYAFQAAKTSDLLARLEIKEAANPGQAKRLGRKVPLRSDWEQVKVDIMRGFLRKKFAHPDLANLLKATANRPLIEGNNWNDRFWGVCKGHGKNWLGVLLMEIRAELNLNSSGPTSQLGHPANQ